MTSIRYRLLVSLLIGLLLCTGLLISLVYIDITGELHELFDDNLHRMAVILKGQVLDTEIEKHNVADRDSAELEESYVIQIWDNKANLLRSSRPELGLPLQFKDGLALVQQGGQPWETYTLKAAQRGYVQIAQPQHIVATMIWESALFALLPFILFFIILFTGAWVAVGRSLRPLNALSKLISDWEADKMRPLNSDDAPNEIKPLVGALNHMLLKLDKAMKMQRQFTADAAHELRTPLTAIKLQAELINRAQSPAERDDALKKLSDGIDRSIHLASQLLSASRAGAVKSMPDFQTMNLYQVIRSCIATFVPIASVRNIEIVFEPSDNCTIDGDEEGIRALTNNLMDNAIRHTPPGGKIQVGLSLQDGKAVMKVTDSGPGIAETEKYKIFQRFYRIPGTSAIGAGLGLSIVKDVANTHGAAVTVENGPYNTGTTFCIVFRFQSKDQVIGRQRD